MVVIRLQRGGANKRPFFHLVVADSRRAASGKFLERVGTRRFANARGFNDIWLATVAPAVARLPKRGNVIDVNPESQIQLSVLGKNSQVRPILKRDVVCSFWRGFSCQRSRAFANESCAIKNVADWKMPFQPL